MFAVVGFHGSLEGFECVVDFLVDGYVNFGGSSPQHNNTIEILLCLEVADILAELFNEFPTGALLHVVAFETFCVVVVESCSEGFDGFEFLADGVNVLFLENFSIDCAFVCVCGIYVPCCELDVVEVGQGNDVFVMEVLFVSAFTYTHFIVLGHGTYGLSQAFTGHEHAGHECSGHGSEANDHHAEFPFCRFGFEIAHFQRIKMVYFCYIFILRSEKRQSASSAGREGRFRALN